MGNIRKYNIMQKIGRKVKVRERKRNIPIGS